MSIGTQSDYGREKGNDARRRPEPLYDGKNPPGAHAEGLTNLMRENHWSADPAANHPRDLNSLVTRTAGSTSRLTEFAAAQGPSKPPKKIKQWPPIYSEMSKQAKKTHRAEGMGGSL